MSALADLVRVHPEHVALVWPHVAERLCAAYLRTDLGHTLDLESDVLKDGATLWVAGQPGGKIDAALVTKLVWTDRNLVCIITACGGAGMARWFDHLKAIERWAKAEGATKMRLYGRKGWARVLKNYRTSNIVMERAL